MVKAERTDQTQTKYPLLIGNTNKSVTNSNIDEITKKHNKRRHDRGNRLIETDTIVLKSQTCPSLKIKNKK